MTTNRFFILKWLFVFYLPVLAYANVYGQDYINTRELIGNDMFSTAIGSKNTSPNSSILHVTQIPVWNWSKSNLPILTKQDKKQLAECQFRYLSEAEMYLLTMNVEQKINAKVSTQLAGHLFAGAPHLIKTGSSIELFEIKTTIRF